MFRLQKCSCVLTPPFKLLGVSVLIFLFGFREEKVSYAHQSYIYLIKNSNTGKKFKYPFSILIYFLQPFLQS